MQFWPQLSQYATASQLQAFWGSQKPPEAISEDLNLKHLLGEHNLPPTPKEQCVLHDQFLILPNKKTLYETRQYNVGINSYYRTSENTGSIAMNELHVMYSDLVCEKIRSFIQWVRTVAVKLLAIRISMFMYTTFSYAAIIKTVIDMSYFEWHNKWYCETSLISKFYFFRVLQLQEKMPEVKGN